MLEVDTAQVAPDQIEGAAEEAALRGEGELQEGRGFEEDGFAFVSEVGGGEALEFGGPVGLFCASPLGGTGQGVCQRRIDGGKDRNHFVAKAVTEEGSVGIGGILSPGEVPFGEPVSDVSTGNFEQGPDDPGGGFREDGGEAGGSGTAQEAGEHGFSLVVESMAGGNSDTDTVGDTLAEKAVAAAAGFLFQIALGGRESGGRVGQAERLGQLRDKGGIGVGFRAPEEVVDVENVTGQPRLVQGVEEQNGVSAPGDGDAEATGEVAVAGGEALGEFVQTPGHYRAYLPIMRFGFIGLVLAGMALAQEPAGLSIKVEVSLVNVAFIVRDRAGILNRSLTKDDIEVFEDGVKRDKVLGAKKMARILIGVWTPRAGRVRAVTAYPANRTLQRVYMENQQQ